MLEMTLRVRWLMPRATMLTLIYFGSSFFAVAQQGQFAPDPALQKRSEALDRASKLLLDKFFVCASARIKEFAAENEKAVVIAEAATTLCRSEHEATLAARKRWANETFRCFGSSSQCADADARAQASLSESLQKELQARVLQYRASRR